jgi:Tfp pilus assembly protein PilO
MTLRKPGPAGPSASNGGGADANPAPLKAPRFALTPSRPTIAVLGGLTGAVLAASVGLYLWQSAEMAEVQHQVDAKRAEVASGEKIASRLKRVEEEYAMTSGQIKFLETSVTANEYVPTLLRQMEQLASSVSLKVNSVRPTMEPAPPPPTDPEARKKAPPPPPYDKIHIDMDIAGSYWSTAKLLYRLTEFPKIMSVESVQITPQGGKPESRTSPNLGVRLRLTGFIFPNDGKTVLPAPATAAATAPAGASPATQKRALRTGAASPVAAPRPGA